MRKKFIVVTTIPASLRFFEGQLNFLNKTFEVMAISSDKKNLEEVGQKEGISVHCIPMQRPISLCKDIISFYRFIVFFLKSNPYIVHGNTPKGGFLSMLSAKITNVPVRIYMSWTSLSGIWWTNEKIASNDGEDFVRVRDRSDMCFCWSETDIVGRPYM